jgi:hypothetical protein
VENPRRQQARGDEAVSEVELWRAAVGFEGRYEVSNIGRVRSLISDGMVMKPRPNADGYPCLVLRNADNKRVGVRVHRLVAEAFVPGKNALHREVGHLDNNRANPNVSNLKWVSRIENTFHRRAHGTHGAGEKHPRAKLSEAQVVSIIESIAAGKLDAEIAEQFGVSSYTVNDIAQGKRWKHVPRPVFKPRFVRGLNNPSGKLSPEQKAEIVALSKTGMFFREIGARLGVSKATAHRVARSCGQ